MKSGSAATYTISPNDMRTVVATPIHVSGQARGAVVAVLESDPTPISQRILILELVSYALQQWDSSQTIEHLDWEARTASAITELIGQIETSPSHNYACMLATNTLNDHFRASRSAIGLLGAGTGVTLKAISGEAEFDSQADLAQRIKAAMDETVIRDEITAWPPLSADDRHAAINHRKLAALPNVESIISVPLKTVAGKAIGVWLSTGSPADLHDEKHLNALRTIAPYLATSLEVRKAADPGPIRAAVTKVTGADASIVRLTMMAAVLLLCVLSFLPVTHRIKSSAVIEPVLHRFITVPFDGVLKETFVRPGDRVTKGQRLAVMDDRELGWKLNGLTAEAVTAGKKRDFAMANHDTHEAQIAGLEQQRLEQQIQALRNRQQNLEITAAIDGFILKGDLEEAHGAPVSIGQSLFEIGPLTPVKLEVAVPEDEIAYVRQGMTVTARLDGHPRGAISGTIETLRPRSEIRHNRNVFIAEVILGNEDQQLRPGMTGRARISGDRKMLGWIWLHKAVHRVRAAIGV
jgi:hypothetical protein